MNIAVFYILVIACGLLLSLSAALTGTLARYRYNYFNFKGRYEIAQSLYNNLKYDFRKYKEKMERLKEELKRINEEYLD